MNTKLILTVVVALATEALTPAARAGWPFSSSCGTYQPQCYSQPRYYQPSCQTYRPPVQYYQPQCGQQYYPQQYGSGQYCQPSRQTYQPPVVVQVYHPPVVTTTTRIVWLTRPTAQPSCQSGRCSNR